MKNVLFVEKKIDENINNEVVKSPKELFKIDYFLYSIDQTIIVLRDRFEQFKIYEYIFCFLFSIKKLKYLDSNNLKEYVLTFNVH